MKRSVSGDDGENVAFNLTKKKIIPIKQASKFTHSYAMKEFVFFPLSERKG